eukprot:TRINITY_DN24002_c0_g1_i2.p1 TRINITY_DN24002_c0_g1~~TRINITY_DN24002_c0_g1_i2.p1  ORF type:complete len:352 (+),score=49.63 TRINITY_DN24002_c0_g1_i2:123-1178(+)
MTIELEPADGVFTTAMHSVETSPPPATVGAESSRNATEHQSPSHWAFFRGRRTPPSFEDTVSSWTSADSSVRRNHELVRTHGLEIFFQAFPRLLVMFTLFYCLFTFVAWVVYCWVVASFIGEIDEPCDKPLRLWAVVDFFSTLYNWGHAAVVRYRGRRNASTMRQCWLRVHLVLETLFDIVWFSFGFYWLLSSKTCAETSPTFYKALKVYMILSFVVGVFVWINAIGLYTVVYHMVRLGVLRTSKGAPPETLKSMQVIKFDPDHELFKDNLECCICLTPFSAESPIRATTCDHTFHEKCLGNWLCVNRTCPLCRFDLTQQSPTQPETSDNSVQRFAEDPSIMGQDTYVEDL